MARRDNFEADTYDKYSSPKTFRSMNHYSSGGSVSTIFGIILLAIILMNIPQFVDGNVEYISFSNFLDILQDAPVIDFDWIDEVFHEIDREFKFDFSDSLGIVIDLSWLLTPINWFVKLFGGLAFLATGIVQLVSYIVYFIPFIFGF